MKLTLLSLTLVAFLIGCSSAPKEDTSTIPSATAEPAASPVNVAETPTPDTAEVTKTEHSNEKSAKKKKTKKAKKNNKKRS